MQEYLVDENIETLPPPAYFPDFAPCDFFLFPVLKQNVLLDEDSTHDHPPSDELFFTVFFTCVYTQDRIQTGISVFRRTEKVLQPTETSVKSCGRRKSFAVRRTHFTSRPSQRAKGGHGCNVACEGGAQQYNE